MKSTIEKKKSFYGAGRFWVIQDNNPFIDSISKIISSKKAKQVLFFYFSTLYNKIPHDTLLAVLNSINEFSFTGGT